MAYKRKTKQLSPKVWRATPEDQRILQALQDKLGVGHPQIVRIALRKLAEHEGLRAA
jgi:hypothetical protein